MNLTFPPDIVVKAGSVGLIARKASTLGMKKPLIVSDPVLSRLGLTRLIQEAMASAYGELPVFDGCSENPAEPDVARGAEVYRKENCDGLVALGGGSSMDVAKAIRIVSRHGGSILEYDVMQGGMKKIGRDLPPLIAVPTTAGSGSETTLGTVIIDPENHVKVLVFSPFLASSAAVLDPELTVSLPPQVTAATGMDALIHAIEAFTSKGSNPVVEGLCRTSIELAAAWLKKAVANGENLEARTGMMTCALTAGMAFCNAGLGAVHAAAHQLSSRFGVPHGLANSLMLPAVMRFNGWAVSDKYLEIVRMLGYEVDSADDAAKAMKDLAACLDLPLRLRDVGVTEELYETMSEDALKDAALGMNPLKVAKEDFIRLYQESF